MSTPGIFVFIISIKIKLKYVVSVRKRTMRVNANYRKFNVNFHILLTTTDTTEDNLISASGLLRVNSNFLQLDSNLNKLLLLVIVRHLNRSADFIYHNDETAEEEGGDGGED